jgi:hypothetical protein
MTNIVSTNFVVPNFAMTNFVIATFVMTTFVMTTYVMTSFVMPNFVMINFVSTNCLRTNFVSMDFKNTNFIIKNFIKRYDLTSANRFFPLVFDQFASLCKSASNNESSYFQSAGRPVRRVSKRGEVWQVYILIVIWPPIGRQIEIIQ